ncbi:MAG: DUF433 domain-containing protein, partial [Leptospiraceae bacterium]|nr:DUF433 domain-containing protein [Leptospiraceae bacterium]
MIAESVNVDPEIVSGTPVFKNTRVPIQTLFDYLATGESLETYLEDYPSVEKKQIYSVLDFAGKL